MRSTPPGRHAVPARLVAELHRIAPKFGVRHLRVFGSYARGDVNPGSDLDLIVELGPRASLLDLVAFEREAAEALGIKVDVQALRRFEPVSARSDPG